VKSTVTLRATTGLNSEDGSWDGMCSERWSPL